MDPLNKIALQNTWTAGGAGELRAGSLGPWPSCSGGTPALATGLPQRGPFAPAGGVISGRNCGRGSPKARPRETQTLLNCWATSFCSCLWCITSPILQPRPHHCHQGGAPPVVPPPKCPEPEGDHQQPVGVAHLRIATCPLQNNSCSPARELCIFCSSEGWNSAFDPSSTGHNSIWLCCRIT